jgi:PAS domain S-box-containing protein
VASDRGVARYGVALVCVGVATGVRLLLGSTVGSHFPLATLFMAVLGASAYGGRGPGLLATLLGAVAAFRLMMPDQVGVGLDGAQAWVGLGLYFGVSIPIVLLSDALRDARNRAEALAESASRDRDRLRITLASIGEGVIVTDSEGRVVSMNAVAQNLSGRAVGEATGRPLDEVLQIVDDADRAKTHNLARQVLAQRGHASLTDALLLLEGGHERWIDVTAAPIRDTDGAVNGVVLVFRDVAERRHAQIAHRLLASIVASSQDAIYGKALDGTITSWNEGAERLYGYRAEEVIGQTSGILTPAELVAEQSAVLKQHHEAAEHFETVRRRKDGVLIPVSTSISPVRNEAGVVIGSSTISRDITRQKQAESALKAAQDELRLEDKRKDEFLAILAHELRNPLAPLRNALGILKKAEAGTKIADDARDLAERQIRHITRLVDDLLDVSRITHGRIELKKRKTLLSSAISQAVETADPVIRSREHQFTVVVPDEPIWLEADETRFIQVLANLLNNAAQYTAPGGRISLTAAKDGAAVEIRISDTGLGIARESLPRVFDMFTQVSQPELRAPSSLGIGLRLVKGLVEMHGGTVEALSDGMGHGSVFVVRLPTESTPAASVASTQPAAPAPPARRRVLIVDDNVDAATSLSVLLDLEGHETHVATGGQEALANLDAKKFDVALLDIGMPGMDGHEVARRVRQNPALAGLKLVALTGWGQEHDLQRAKDAGFDLHLTKPVEPATLYQVITEGA